MILTAPSNHTVGIPITQILKNPIPALNRWHNFNKFNKTRPCCRAKKRVFSKILYWISSVFEGVLPLSLSGGVKTAPRLITQGRAYNNNRGAFSMGPNREQSSGIEGREFAVIIFALDIVLKGPNDGFTIISVWKIVLEPAWGEFLSPGPPNVIFRAEISHWSTFISRHAKTGPPDPAVRAHRKGPH